MSSNSKQDLLEWLQSDYRMLGWNTIFAIQKDKADALLTQEYIRRFKTSSYLDPINGETAPDNGYKVYMQNFVLDHPRLSFDNADITGSRASLRMKILGGNQVGLKQVGDHWYPQRIDRIEPLVGPELRLRLELSDVPGYVADNGALTLDLHNSDDFVVTFSDSRRVRELGGDFFKELFRGLPDHQRVWSFGSIEHGGADLMRPESFILRTQRNPSVALAPMESDDADEVDGALVGLVAMGPSNGPQNMPGPEYRYLIPDDNGDYSATVLLDKAWVALATVLSKLPVEFFTNVEFKIERAENGDLTATAIAGVIAAETDSYVSPFHETNHRGTVDCRAYLEISTDELPLKNVLKFHVSGDRVSMELVTVHTATADFTRYEEIVATPHSWTWGNSCVGIWHAEVDVEIMASWQIQDLQSATLKLEEYRHRILPRDGSYKFEGDGNPNEGQDMALGFFHIVWGMATAATSFASLVSDRGPLAAARAALAKDLRSDLYMEELIDKTIKLNFGGAILAGERHMPRDIACFGIVAPQLTTFAVTPLEKIVTHGSTLQLATVPTQANVTWSAESVEGSTDDPGHFDQHTHGLYLAPGAAGIEGEFTRVRVTATDPGSGFASSALLTVVKNALQVSPLLSVCQVGDEGVSLKADSVVEGPLQWRILGASPHGRLAQESGTANRYVPGENLPDKSFIVEEVEVRNSSTDEHRTLCIVTQMTLKRPSDVVVDKRDEQHARVWLSIHFSGVSGVDQLTVVHGPGQIDIDEDGKPYYQGRRRELRTFLRG
ncbi:hypothetical protein R6U79_19680 [Pseudomonas putida]|uniref:hypothetical protein n=1 Tax=Pseudomonas putida TaxID=303 RepID=UPI0029DE5293|nr:hypothetical protein [Pseudomonas putida]WPJ99409.1 hypothetical protein R6U79_19680 [Pseudomonas putida]